MIKSIFLGLSLILMVPALGHASCDSTPSFRTYALANNLYGGQQAATLLATYATQNRITPTCAYEMAVHLIPFLAQQWTQESQRQGCFEEPIRETCPVEHRNEILGNLSELDQWERWYSNNRSEAPGAICATSTDAGSVFGNLAVSINGISNVLSRSERMRTALDYTALGCAQSSVVTAHDSSELAHFRALLERGEAAPLSDFLHLWYPTREPALTNDPYFYNCQSNPTGTLNRLVPGVGANNAAGNFLTNECRPDALYTWGPRIKLDTMVRTMPSNEVWTGAPNPNPRAISSDTLFTAISPASTFGYGEIPIRLRIKPNVPFRDSGYGGGTIAGEIGVRDDEYHDFTLNDASVIESWSYATPELYDEIVRDVQRLLSNERAIYYTNTGETRLYTNADSYATNETVLKQRFLLLIRMILNGEGRVVYASGSCRNRDVHYNTARPTYFNPR